MRYFDLPVHSAGYLVLNRDMTQTYYWGYSHHVARLIANVMATTY